MAIERISKLSGGSSSGSSILNSAMRKLQQQVGTSFTSGQAPPAYRSTSPNLSSAPTLKGTWLGDGGQNLPPSSRDATRSPTLYGTWGAPKPANTAANLPPSSGGNTGSSQSATQQQAANRAAAESGGATNAGLSGRPKSAFGQSFTEDALNEIASNPDALISAWYDFNKLPRNGGEMAMSQDQNARRLMLMWSLYGAGDIGDASTGTGSYLDYANKFLQTSRTPGQQYASPADIIARLSTDRATDPIYQQLYGESLTPAGQANNWISAYATALSATVPREMLSAHMEYLAQLERQFVAEKSQGKHAGLNFGQYLAANGMG